MDKQCKLNFILEQATTHFLEARYREAIYLYEEALDLITKDEYYLTDVCVIEYALCSCYATQEDYFQKATNRYIPLVVSWGNTFPVLYYGLAKLLFEHGRYQQTENVINSGLKALDLVKEKTSFKANWPGTNVQIPESDFSVLINLLISLKTGCVQIKNMDCSDVYLSDEFEIDDSTLLGDEDVDMISVESGTDIEEYVDPNVLKKKPQILNADVPEFIPRNFIVVGGNVNNSLSPITSNSSLSSPLETNMHSTPENKMVVAPETNMCSTPETKSDITKNTAERHAKSCQTIAIKVVEKSCQTKIKPVNTYTQTPKLEQQNTCKCKQQIETKDQFCKAKMTSIMDENKKLHAQLEKLDEENKENMNALEEYKKQFLQDQKKILVAENSTYIASIKSEALKESLQSKIDRLKTKVQALTSSFDDVQNNNQIMNSVISTQSLQFFNFQERVLTEYLKKCRRMVFDLTTALPYLTLQSLPSIADCHRHIKLWQQELKQAEDYSAQLKDCYQQVTKDIRLSNYTNISHLTEFCTRLAEPNDILHDSFVPAINCLLEKNLFYHQQNVQLQQQNVKFQQQNVKFQQQYSQWWNAYGTVNQPRPAITAAPPMYYNVQGPPLVQISDVTANGSRKNSVVIASSSSTSEYASKDPNVAEPPNSVTDASKSAQQPTKATPSMLNATINNAGAPEDCEIVELNVEPNINTWWKSTKDDEKEQECDNSNPVEKPEKEHLFISDGSHIRISKEIPKSSTTEEIYNEVNDVSVNMTANSDTCQLEQNLTEACVIDTKNNTSETTPSINPFSIPLKNKVLQSPILNEVEQENTLNKASENYTLARTDYSSNLKQTPSLDDSSSCTIVNNQNPDNNSSVASKVDTSKKENNYSKQEGGDFKHEEHNEDEVYRFHGIFNNSEAQNTQHPFSFSLTSNCDTSIPSTSGTVIDPTSDNQLQQEVSLTASKQNQQDIDYSRLPEAVQKGGKNFCDLYLYIVQRVPEKTESEVFGAIKKVRRKNTKLSGMTKDAIVAAVRTELEADRKVYKYKDPPALVSTGAQSEAASLNNDNTQIMCTICIEPFGALRLSELSCGHRFHKKCVIQWFVYKSECPVCRVFPN